MSQRIDAELERVKIAGLTPFVIEVGDDIYNELYNRAKANSHLIFAAPLVGPNEKARINNLVDLSAYRGIELKRLGGVPADFLRIVTEPKAR